MPRGPIRSAATGLGDRRLALLSNAECGGERSASGAMPRTIRAAFPVRKSVSRSRASGPVPRATYDAQMEPTTLPIFELGLLLLVAALAGWLARRVPLPAIVGYLAVGLLVSPFTPGYVADHEPAPAPGRRRRRPAPVRGRHRGRRQPAPSRARRPPLGAPAPDGHHRRIATVGSRRSPACRRSAPGLSASAVALSSSVVIVNITRSRRRTTTRETEQVLLGWSVLQDVTGVALRSSCSRCSGAPPDRRSIALVGLARLRRPGGRGRPGAPAACPPAPAQRARPVPDRVGRDRACARRGRGGRRRDPARARRVRRRPGDHREPRSRRGPPPPAAVPRRLRGAVLRRDRHR